MCSPVNPAGFLRQRSHTPTITPPLVPAPSPWALAQIPARPCPRASRLPKFWGHVPAGPPAALQIPLACFWDMSVSPDGMWGVGGAEKLHSHSTTLQVLHGMPGSPVGSTVVLEGCCAPGADAVIPREMLSLGKVVLVWRG